MKRKKNSWRTRLAKLLVSELVLWAAFLFLPDPALAGGSWNVTIGPRTRSYDLNVRVPKDGRVKITKAAGRVKVGRDKWANNGRSGPMGVTDRFDRGEQYPVMSAPDRYGLWIGVGPERYTYRQIAQWGGSFNANIGGNLVAGVNDNKTSDNQGEGYRFTVEVADPAPTQPDPRLREDYTLTVQGTEKEKFTNIRLFKGERVTISAWGSVDPDRGGPVGPGGRNYDWDQGDRENFPAPPPPAYGLWYGINTANHNKVKRCYSGLTNEIFTVPEDGFLVLGINDNNCRDNKGSFTVSISLTNKPPGSPPTIGGPEYSHPGQVISWGSPGEGERKSWREKLKDLGKHFLWEVAGNVVGANVDPDRNPWWFEDGSLSSVAKKHADEWIASQRNDKMPIWIKELQVDAKYCQPGVAHLDITVIIRVKADEADSKDWIELRINAPIYTQAYQYDDNVYVWCSDPKIEAEDLSYNSWDHIKSFGLDYAIERLTEYFAQKYAESYFQKLMPELVAWANQGGHYVESFSSSDERLYVYHGPISLPNISLRQKSVQMGQRLQQRVVFGPPPGVRASSRILVKSPKGFVELQTLKRENQAERRTPTGAQRGGGSRPSRPGQYQWPVINDPRLQTGRQNPSDRYRAPTATPPSKRPEAVADAIQNVISIVGGMDLSAAPNGGSGVGGYTGGGAQYRWGNSQGAMDPRTRMILDTTRGILPAIAPKDGGSEEFQKEVSAILNAIEILSRR